MSFKSNPLIHFILAVSFFVSGLTVNLVQFILYFTLAQIDIQLYRKINYYLTYSLWSPLVFIGSSWGLVDLNVYYDEDTKYTLSSPNHGVYLMNHTFEIDWLISWLLMEPEGKLGSSKSFVKKSLRFMPIIGWSWVFGEFVFLERNLDKDFRTIIDYCKKYLQFEYPVSLLLFAEGTRFTKEKHANSVEFAKKRNLPILKHHLLPRSRGFHLWVNTFKKEKKAGQELLFSMLQLRFPKDQPSPTFMQLMRGKKIRADVYCKIFPVSEVPCETEKETADFLYEIYQKQDDLVDYYFENNYTFPGKPEKVQHRLYPALIVFFWLSYTAWLTAILVMSSSWTTIIIISVTILIAVLVVNQIMINSTKIKSSSSYGLENQKHK